MSDRRNAAPGGALRRLASLLTARNVLDCEMTKIIGRPMDKGFGQLMASQIFDREDAGIRRLRNGRVSFRPQMTPPDPRGRATQLLPRSSSTTPTTNNAANRSA